MSTNVVEFKTICRGSGKIFISLSVKGLCSDEKLVASITSSKGNVPAMLFSDNEIPSSSDQTNAIIDNYVLVLPQLGLKQTIKLFKTDAAKNETLICCKTLSNLEAKIASRLNYRRNANEACRIRDFDQNRDAGKAIYEIWEYIPDGTEIGILHGILRLPASIINTVTVACFSELLDPLSSRFVTFTDRLITPVPEAPTFKQREIRFSLRVRNNAQMHIFQAYNEQGKELFGFAAYEKDAYEDTIRNGTLRYNNASVDGAYHDWFLSHRCPIWKLEAQKNSAFEFEPTYSIVVPLYKTPLNFFCEMLSSVQNQSYQKWELILVNASPENQELANAVNEAVASDARIVATTLEQNLGITLNTNRGISLATGDFVCFFDHDDLLESNLLFEYTKEINLHPDTDLIYCDEDKLSPDGKYFQPFFKPEFSLDLLRNNNYICHLLTVRKSVLDKLPLASAEYDGAQDHNMALRVSEVARRISHVPQVLYHWRLSPTSTAGNDTAKPYATAAGILAVTNHLKRLGISATVEQSRRPFTYRIAYTVNGNPKVSILIPTKDNRKILQNCIESILHKSTYDNYEIVLIENNSEQQDTFDYYKKLVSQHKNIHVERWPNEFNYSKINNFGFAKSNGDYLILLNNDTEVITPNWIERMLGICQREEVGAVGVRLYYPDNTIQHAGLCVNGVVAEPLHHCLPKGAWGYFALADDEQNLSAVTAACMMTKRTVYEAAGGFDDNLAIAFNDIDFCLKIRSLNKLIVYTPEVELYHYESFTRGYDELSSEKRARRSLEASYIRQKWASFYAQGDPFFNPNFDQRAPYNRQYRLKQPD